MPDEEQRVSDIVKLLPYALQRRFNSLGAYVRAIVEEMEENRRRKAKLSNEDISFIQLAVFIHSIDWFLREGTRAARASIDTLQHLGLTGFSVGSTVFERDNENTLLGRNLAEGLLRALQNPEIVTLIKSAPNMRSLIRRLRDELNRG